MASAQFQPVPLIAVALRPVGRVSVTVTVPVEASGPLFLTESVYSAPIWPWRKSPVWDLSMTRLIDLMLVGSSSIVRRRIAAAGDGAGS